ncbi:MAG: hypothetical protein KAV87_57850 [Desulfobacteraceae bacterium]|nr:hypothetical protein [Desulfobacteraceae bacterium]
MALYTKRNGMLEEVTERLTIKAPGPMGYMDYEDTLRLQQIAQMITADMEQTTKATWETEQNPALKEVMKRVDSGTIKTGGAMVTAALAKRWSKMENSTQRKAEMLGVLAAQGKVLKYSMEHNLIAKGTIPPFMFTLWARRF